MKSPRIDKCEMVKVVNTDMEILKSSLTLFSYFLRIMFPQTSYWTFIFPLLPQYLTTGMDLNYTIIDTQAHQ